MKTTRMITVALVSSALLGVLGFALVTLNISLATVLNIVVGTFASAGLFSLLLWDTGRTIKAHKTAARLEQRATAKAYRTQHAALRRQAAIANC